MPTFEYLDKDKKARTPAKQQAQPSLIGGNAAYQAHPFVLARQSVFAPDMLTAHDVQRLQRLVGNQVVGQILAGATRSAAGGAPGGGIVMQRDIEVRTGADTTDKSAPGLWAFKYTDKIKGAPYGRALDALRSIEKEAAGQIFDSVDDLFDRVTAVMKAKESRSRNPIWKETSPTLVGMEIDYYFPDIETHFNKSIPKMKLSETYESNWDKKGGFGAEYHTPEEQNWVIHVHRGPSGGLKSAKIKTWDKKGEGHNGFTIFQFDKLVTLGVAQTDNTRLHV